MTTLPTWLGLTIGATVLLSVALHLLGRGSRVAYAAAAGAAAIGLALAVSAFPRGMWRAAVIGVVVIAWAAILLGAGVALERLASVTGRALRRAVGGGRPRRRATTA